MAAVTSGGAAAGRARRFVPDLAAVHAGFARAPAAPWLAAPSASEGLPRRFLIVSDAWEPQVNGVVRTYEHIAAGLVARGCTVRIIGPGEFNTVSMPGYAEIPLAVLPGRRIGAMIDAFVPEVTHIAVEGPLGWAARAHCLRRALPFSTAFHTNFPAYVAMRSPRLFARAAERLTVAAVRRFHTPAHLTYVSTGSSEAQLRAWGFRGRLERLSRGVDCDLFHPGHGTPERSGPPVLLYVGRVAPEKNLEAFLALTEAQIGPARKVVVGDGPHLATLRRRFPEAEFRGTLTGEALAAAYRAADCFVFPSRTDTFGIVLIEAMASGLPIAGLDAPGPRDIVTEPLLGAVDDDLAAAVRRALAAPGSRQARHRIARERYSWDAVAEAFRRQSVEVSP
jgi:glycosyltransferase involved in cell wall biosynthesis